MRAARKSYDDQMKYECSRHSSSSASSSPHCCCRECAIGSKDLEIGLLHTMIEVAEDFEDYLQYLEEKRRRSRERSASRQVESWLCSCLILSFFGAFASLTLESPSFRRDSSVHVVQEQRVRVVAEVTNASFDMGALGVAVLRSWKSPY
jgi:hypothetical protein